MPTHVLSTIYADGSHAPHYVNGRLLAAEDLIAEREATRKRLLWLGKASGHGIIDGLDVKTSQNTLTVTTGLGITKQGYAISLEAEVTLSLSQLPEAEPTGQAAEDGEDEAAAPTVDLGVFAVCGFQPTSGVSSVPNGDYVLTVAPTIKFDGYAPVKATPGSTSPPACAFKWEIDGLQFKAIALTGFALDVQLTNPNHRRNRLAHWCFAGNDPRFEALGDNPFFFSDTYGGLDLPPASTDLTPCDLPLAVFQWDGGQLVFVDRWSVRRRLIRPFALTFNTDAKSDWRGMLSDRRVADGHARFLQFQDQIAELGALRSAAAETFQYLPPAGLFRINPEPLLKRIDTLLEVDDVQTGKVPKPNLNDVLLETLLKTAKQRASAYDSIEFNTIQRARQSTSDPSINELKNLVYTMSSTYQTLKAELESIKANPNLKIPVSGGLTVGETGNELDLGDGESGTTGDATEPGRPETTAEDEAEQQRREHLSNLRDLLRGMALNPNGIDLDAFLGAVVQLDGEKVWRVARVGMIWRDLLDTAIQQSWYDEPIDIEHELSLINFYFVLNAFAKGENQPYVLFTKAELAVDHWVDLTNPRELLP